MAFAAVNPIYLEALSWNERQFHHHLQSQGAAAIPAVAGAGVAEPSTEQLPPGPAAAPRPVSMTERARLAKIPPPEAALQCPRCESTNTKFCYFNNYSLTQPRHFCKSCRRYWTRGGALRNVPVGGGCRRNRRSKPSSKSSSKAAASKPAAGGAGEPPAPASGSCANPLLYLDAGGVDGMEDYGQLFMPPPPAMPVTMQFPFLAGMEQLMSGDFSGGAFGDGGGGALLAQLASVKMEDIQNSAAAVRGFDVLQRQQQQQLVGVHGGAGDHGHYYGDAAAAAAGGGSAGFGGSFY